ncbi:MAG: hypothetical protein Q9159_001454 [Coniocarpon cinnabarinum]
MPTGLMQWACALLISGAASSRHVGSRAGAASPRDLKAPLGGGPIKTPPIPWPGAGHGSSPDYSEWMFQYPLPISPQASPKYSSNVNGTQPINYYEMSVDKFQQQVYPNLGPANMAGYDGRSTGPTYRVPVGSETIIRLTNNNDLTSSMHLHGAWTRSPWDGWANDTINPGQYKDYYYSGSQSARTLWYHDHADHHTSVDAYYGQNGFHIIYDPNEDSLGLPSGNYDIPIAIIDKAYQANGDLVDPSGETINFFGDVIHANGQPWPYLNVEPRKYRFRFLNTALSRPFSLYFADADGIYQNFNVIGSDAGLFSAPVETQTVILSMGERYEVVMDFSGFQGQNITLGNEFLLPDIGQMSDTGSVMRFVVGDTVSDSSNNDLPSALANPNANVQNPPNNGAVDQTFNFQRNGGQWTINGVVYDDVEARTLARPPMGTVQNWELRYAAGPGVHPVHIHLIDFRIVSRQGGTRGVLPYESAGLKDVVLLEPGETVNVVARFGPWNGLYQFHCHNLIHEDHEMMDVFNTTALENLGYDLQELLEFDDPMDTRYAAKDVGTADDSEEFVTNTLMPGLVNSGAYRRLNELLAAEGVQGQAVAAGER